MRSAQVENHVRTDKADFDVASKYDKLLAGKKSPDTDNVISAEVKKVLAGGKNMTKPVNQRAGRKSKKEKKNKNSNAKENEKEMDSNKITLSVQKYHEQNLLAESVIQRIHCYILRKQN